MDKDKKEVGTQIFINNGWNNYKIIQLKRKMIELKIYRYLHKAAGTYYKNLHQKLFLPHTTIMTIASGTLFVSLSSQVSDANRYWINLFVSFLTLLGTILSVWVKFFDAENKSINHLDTSKNYSLIIEDIDEELSLDFEDKSDYTEYINKIKKMINEEKKKSLDIDQKFWDSYLKSVSKGELVMLNYNIIDQELNREYNNNFNNQNTNHINFNMLDTHHNITDDISNVINNNNPFININNQDIKTNEEEPNKFLKSVTEVKEDKKDDNNHLVIKIDKANTYYNDLTKTNIDVLRKNLKYQLERNSILD